MQVQGEKKGIFLCFSLSLSLFLCVCRNGIIHPGKFIAQELDDGNYHCHFSGVKSIESISMICLFLGRRTISSRLSCVSSHRSELQHSEHRGRRYRLMMDHTQAWNSSVPRLNLRIYYHFCKKLKYQNDELKKSRQCKTPVQQGPVQA